MDVGAINDGHGISYKDYILVFAKVSSYTITSNFDKSLYAFMALCKMDLLSSRLVQEACN